MKCLKLRALLVLYLINLNNLNILINYNDNGMKKHVIKLLEKLSLYLNYNDDERSNNQN